MVSTWLAVIASRPGERAGMLAKSSSSSTRIRASVGGVPLRLAGVVKISSAISEICSNATSTSRPYVKSGLPNRRAKAASGSGRGSPGRVAGAEVSIRVSSSGSPVFSNSPWPKAGDRVRRTAPPPPPAQPSMLSTANRAKDRRAPAPPPARSRTAPTRPAARARWPAAAVRSRLARPILPFSVRFRLPCLSNAHVAEPSPSLVAGRRADPMHPAQRPHPHPRLRFPQDGDDPLFQKPDSQTCPLPCRTDDIIERQRAYQRPFWGWRSVLDWLATKRATQAASLPHGCNQTGPDSNSC